MYRHPIKREQTWTAAITRKAHIVALTVVVTALFVAAGTMMLHSSNTARKAAEVSSGVPSSSKAGNAAAVGATQAKTKEPINNQSNIPKDLLQPYSMGFAPYAYVPYDANATMAGYGAATQAKNFFAAFILGSGCKPLWDGNSSLDIKSSRSQAINGDIKNVRSKGGDVAVSFGGVNGTELANSCTDAVRLQAAYQSVINAYSLKHINFDLEGKGQTDAAAMTRRVQAVVGLQKAAPGLKVSLTIPVEVTGLDAAALNTARQFHDAGVVLSNINIMAMDFGAPAPANSPLHAESARVIAAAQASAKQLQQIYGGLTTAQAYKALGIVVLVGVNDVPKEIFTVADAQAVRAFAASNGVGTLSMWSANRDMPCTDGISEVSRPTCSSVSQTKYQFANLLAMPPR